MLLWESGNLLQGVSEGNCGLIPVLYSKSEWRTLTSGNELVFYVVTITIREYEGEFMSSCVETACSGWSVQEVHCHIWRSIGCLAEYSA